MIEERQQAAVLGHGQSEEALEEEVFGHVEPATARRFVVAADQIVQNGFTLRRAATVPSSVRRKSAVFGRKRLG